MKDRSSHVRRTGRWGSILFPAAPIFQPPALPLVLPTFGTKAGLIARHLPAPTLLLLPVCLLSAASTNSHLRYNEWAGRSSGHRTPRGGPVALENPRHWQCAARRSLPLITSSPGYDRHGPVLLPRNSAPNVTPAAYSTFEDPMLNPTTTRWHANPCIYMHPYPRPCDNEPCTTQRSSGLCGLAVQA